MHNVFDFQDIPTDLLENHEIHRRSLNPSISEKSFKASLQRLKHARQDSETDYIDNHLKTKSRLLSSHLCRRPVNVVVQASTSQLKETDAMVFMTKVEEPLKPEKLESFEHDTHDDLMQQLHQKRTQIEQGLTKASDDLKN